MPRELRREIHGKKVGLYNLEKYKKDVTKVMRLSW
jgi:hypothetical protein